MLTGPTLSQLDQFLPIRLLAGVIYSRLFKYTLQCDTNKTILIINNNVAKPLHVYDLVRSDLIHNHDVGSFGIILYAT
jgi:hypothetical protein